MAYCAASDVASHCQSLLGAEDNFSVSTCPTFLQVNSWIEAGAAIIDTFISGEGYSTPVAATATIYEWLTNLNALYGAAMAEMSRVNTTIELDIRTRGQIYEDMFWDGLLKQLSNMNLSNAGVDKISAGKLYAGAMSKSDKQVQEADTDRVSPRFRRDAFKFPGRSDPSATTAS